MKISKASRILVPLVLAVAGSFATVAMADEGDLTNVPYQPAPASTVSRAQVRAELAEARARGDLDPAASYIVTPRVTRREAVQAARSGPVTRAEVRAETRQYLHDHPNRNEGDYSLYD